MGGSTSILPIHFGLSFIKIGLRKMLKTQQFYNKLLCGKLLVVGKKKKKNAIMGPNENQ